MAAVNKRPNLQTTAARRHSLNRKVGHFHSLIFLVSNPDHASTVSSKKLTPQIPMISPRLTASPLLTEVGSQVPAFNINEKPKQLADALMPQTTLHHDPRFQPSNWAHCTSAKRTKPNPAKPRKAANAFIMLNKEVDRLVYPAIWEDRPTALLHPMRIPVS